MKDIGFITTYVGIPTFYNAPHIGLEDVKEGMAVVVGAPIDNGILFPRLGARFGPRSIREASLMYRGLQDVASEKTSVNVDTHIARRLKPQINLGDLGDFHVNPQDIMQTTESVIEGMSDIVKLGGVPILLGGDHYLAYPGFEGFARGLMERGENPKLGYVHIDSHTDFRDGYGDLGRYNHGTCARRISENSVVSYKNMSWVGLNGSVMDADIYRMYKKQELKMSTAKDVRTNGMEHVLRQAIEAAADGTDAVYVSVDIDVVDASHAPGTGVPVFEGIGARDFLDAMAIVSEYDCIKALDLCEVAPPLDPTGNTPYLAVNGLLGFLGDYLYDVVDLDS